MDLVDEKLKELEAQRVEAETAKLRVEADRMDLSNTLDMAKVFLTAVGASAAVLVALQAIGLIGGQCDV